MANKPTSAPIFGSPTAGQVKSVQGAIQANSAKLIKNVSKARKVLTEAEPVKEADVRKKSK